MNRFAILLVLLIWTPLTAVSQERATVGLAFGLNGVSDWSTQHPFLDIMKTARPWIGHFPGQWGGKSFEDLLTEGHLDSSGWPRTVPLDVEKIETLILTDQPPEATHLSGRYHVLFDGEGDLQVTGRGRVVSRSKGQRVFSYTPGPGAVGIAISRTDPNDPIRNIRVVREDQLEIFAKGALFNPDWLAIHDATTLVRFMDWMNTNDSVAQHWDDLPRDTDFSYAWRGVPLNVMVSLANELDVDPWFTIPHLANDALVAQFAETVKQTVEPERQVFVEYSNEVWNFLFEQSRWAQQQAEERWGDIGDGWMQFYGLRAAEVMGIWTDVFGADAESRLVRVVGVHTGWPELEQAILYGEKAIDALGYPPAEGFDAYAVTGYFGYELGEPETITPLLEAAENRAREAGVAEGLSRVALREFVKSARFDGAASAAAEIVRNGSLRELTETLWPYHAEAARAAGLDLVMYEGGTHAAPVGDGLGDERLVSFLTFFNYTQDMGELYRHALSRWHAFTESPFNAFVDVAPPSQWGSWGALRYLGDSTPRWDALTAAAPD